VQCPRQAHGLRVVHAVIPSLLEVIAIFEITRHRRTKIARPETAARGQAQVAALGIIRQFFFDQPLPNRLKQWLCASSRTVTRGTDLQVGLGLKKYWLGRHGAAL
jgi:hypothetical protein